MTPFGNLFQSLLSNTHHTKEDPSAVKIASSAKPLDYDQIVNAVGDKRIVMIGEASHGTEDFYKHRAEITKRLIEQKGFTVVTLESDFPDTHRVDNYVKQIGADSNAQQALSEFVRYPRWMWRNTVMVEFVEWLRLHNTYSDNKCGIFGIDVYSFEASKKAVLKFVEQNYPDLFDKCCKAYEFYEYSSSGPRLAEIVLKELERIAMEGPFSEELFVALQNARAVKGAAKYNQNCSWNVRDTYFFETLEHIMNRYNSKTVVWAHNSHLGDASQTGMKNMGEINLGQLVREKYASHVANIGFTTYTGTVTASTEWDEPAELKQVKKGMSGSVELLFHQVSERIGQREFVLYLGKNLPSLVNMADQEVITLLGKNYKERAIGVQYLPQTERWSHYFDAKIAKQFDIVIHVDVSRALRPLDIPREWAQAERALKFNLF
jgi:erythromycin esterase-like protein